MTLVELAKKLKISDRMLRKHRAKGMPVTGYKRAKAWYDKHIQSPQKKSVRMGGNHAGGRGKKRNQKAEPEEVKKDTSKTQSELDLREGEIDLESTNSTTLFFSSRASKEKSLAIQAKAELDVYLGTLIKKEDVERDTFAVMRQLRDRLMTVPKRISAAVASEKGVRKCERIITDEIVRTLQGVSGKFIDSSTGTNSKTS